MAATFKPETVLGEVGHRPYPVSAGLWAMGMTWRDLLFMHWPVDVEALRPLVPPSLSIDTFEGSAWLGVVPFQYDRREAPFPARRPRALELSRDQPPHLRDGTGQARRLVFLPGRPQPPGRPARPRHLPPALLRRRDVLRRRRRRGPLQERPHAQGRPTGGVRGPLSARWANRSRAAGAPSRTSLPSVIACTAPTRRASFVAARSTTGCGRSSRRRSRSGRSR